MGLYLANSSSRPLPVADIAAIGRKMVAHCVSVSLRVGTASKDNLKLAITLVEAFYLFEYVQAKGISTLISK